VAGGRHYTATAGGHVLGKDLEAVARSVRTASELDSHFGSATAASIWIEQVLDGGAGGRAQSNLAAVLT